jgi:hypothetical protein
MNDIGVAAEREQQPNNRTEASKRTGLMLGLLGSALLLVFLFQVKISLQNIHFLLDHTVQDDTFYYLQWAWNIVHGMGPTFDGLSRTNGVQPLWAGIVTLLGYFVADKIQFVQAALVLCAILNLLTGLSLVRFFHRCGSMGAALLFVILYAVFMSRTKMVLNGMEISLSMFVFSVYLNWLAGIVRTCDRGESVGSCRFLVGGLIVSLLFLVRVDAAIYVVPLGLFLLLRWYSDSISAIKPIAIVAAVLLFTLATFSATNAFLFGTFTPLSGQVKVLDHYLMVVEPGGGYLGPAFLIETVKTAATVVRRIVLTVIVPETGNEILKLYFLWIAVVVAPMAAFLIGYLFWPAGHFAGAGNKPLFLPSFSRSSDQGFLLRFGALLWVGVAALWIPITIFAPAHLGLAGGLLILALSGCELLLGAMCAFAEPDFSTRGRFMGLFLWITAGTRIWIISFLIGRYYWCNWYFGPEYLLALVTICFGLDRLLSRIPMMRTARPFVYAGLGALLLIASWSPLLTALRSPTTYDAMSLHQYRYKVARWIEQNTDPSAICAASNAGELGYFSDRRFINLEGLVSSKELLELRRQGRPITDYLDRTGLQYVADYDRLPPGQTESQDETFYWIPRTRLQQLKEWVLHLPDETLVFRVFKYLPKAEQAGKNQQ